jgi:Uma2 family endonuclease
MEEEKMKSYDLSETEPMIIAEPFAMYYPTLDLDLKKRYTYADYLTWLDDKRRELIDGFIYLMSAPNEFHARISHLASMFIGSFVRNRKGKCRVYHAPFDVRLPLNKETEDGKIYNVVQPDICVVCDLSKIDKRGCIGAPDLIVEVLSPSTYKKDLHNKLALYEAAGVREYWTVNPKAKTVHIFLLQANGFYDDGIEYETGQKAPVHIFEGLEIDLNELFEE